VLFISASRAARERAAVLGVRSAAPDAVRAALGPTLVPA
jgi:hypothetical protein